MLHRAGRYLRLLVVLAHFSLLREMMFRGNFLAKVLVEILWLSILIVFYKTVFARTSMVASWSEPEYLFFVGCYFALEGLIETFFLENCGAFSELVRTGNLDSYLLQPLDEQFLLSCRSIDWSAAPNVLMGSGVMLLALVRMEWSFDLVRLVMFLVAFCCGIAIAYSFLLMLTTTSIWFVRNQSLYELWWLFTSLMRYPREIFQGWLATPVGWFFTFIIPVMLATNVPASVMVRVFDPVSVAFTILVTLLLLVVSRWVFRQALRHYRSASS